MKTSATESRCILFARTATTLATNSIDGQIATLSDAARDMNFTVVAHLRLNGLSAIGGGIRETLNALVTRKIQDDDFDIIMMTDLSRIARGVNNFPLLAKLVDLGVQIITLDKGVINVAPIANLQPASIFLKEGRGAKRKSYPNQPLDPHADGGGGSGVSSGGRPARRGASRTRTGKDLEHS